MMRQLRSITRQLESDFRGYRSDMPIIAIFEGHRSSSAVPYDELGDPANDEMIRYDRISFFANGDF